jgi:hypothetical protein
LQARAQPIQAGQVTARQRGAHCLAHGVHAVLVVLVIVPGGVQRRHECEQPLISLNAD